MQGHWRRVNRRRKAPQGNAHTSSNVRRGIRRLSCPIRATQPPLSCIRVINAKYYGIWRKQVRRVQPYIYNVAVRRHEPKPETGSRSRWEEMLKYKESV